MSKISASSLYMDPSNVAPEKVALLKAARNRTRRGQGLRIQEAKTTLSSHGFAESAETLYKSLYDEGLLALDASRSLAFITPPGARLLNARLRA